MLIDSEVSSSAQQVDNIMEISGNTPITDTASTATSSAKKDSIQRQSKRTGKNIKDKYPIKPQHGTQTNHKRKKLTDKYDTNRDISYKKPKPSDTAQAAS